MTCSSAKLSRLGTAQVARLDTCYRTLAAASAEPREDDQNAVLRDRICEYFEEASGADEITGEGHGEGKQSTQDVAAGVDGDAGCRNPLSGLPLREPPPALALDVRELLAFSRRSGSSRGGGKGAAPEVRALLREPVSFWAAQSALISLPCGACP